MNITHTPLTSLRTKAGDHLHRVGDVDAADIKNLLSSAVVHFVVADVGKPLRWISEEERFRFWKSDAQVHILGEGEKSLDDFPDGYVYFASEWRTSRTADVVILLEEHH